MLSFAVSPAFRRLVLSAASRWREALAQALSVPQTFAEILHYLMSATPVVISAVDLPFLWAKFEEIYSGGQSVPAAPPQTELRARFSMRTPSFPKDVLQFCKHSRKHEGTGQLSFPGNLAFCERSWGPYTLQPVSDKGSGWHRGKQRALAKGFFLFCRKTCWCLLTAHSASYCLCRRR